MYWNQVLADIGHRLKIKIRKNITHLPECKDKGIRKLIHNLFILNIFEMAHEIQEELIEIQHDNNRKFTFQTEINLKVV